MAVQRFECFQPDTAAEACGLLARFGEEARPLAGGQSLVPMLRLGLLGPRYLVSLAGIPHLADIQADASGELRIGALVTHRQVVNSPVIGEHCSVLAETAKLIGSQAVRNVGTIGGDLCHNEVGADPGAVLLCLNARAAIAGPEGPRSIPLSDFFVDYFETSLQPGEVLTHVDIPGLPDGAGAAYQKLRRRVVDPAIVGACAIVALDGDGAFADVRLGLNGVAPVPLRAVKAEAALIGQRPGEGSIRTAAAAAADEVSPHTDAMASAEYRRAMVPVFVRRALEEAVKRASAN